MLVVRAMLTPFATRLSAALTRLIAAAFCWAAPTRLTLDVSDVLIDDPSEAMLSAAAEAIWVAPSTVFVTSLLLVLLRDNSFDFCRLMLAIVLVVDMLDLLLLLSAAEFFAELED